MPSLDVRSVIYDAHSITLYTLCSSYIGQVKMEKFVHCEVLFVFTIAHFSLSPMCANFQVFDVLPVILA